MEPVNVFTGGADPAGEPPPPPRRWAEGQSTSRCRARARNIRGRLGAVIAE